MYIFHVKIFKIKKPILSIVDFVGSNWNGKKPRTRTTPAVLMQISPLLELPCSTFIMTRGGGLELHGMIVFAELGSWERYSQHHSFMSFFCLVHWDFSCLFWGTLGIQFPSNPYKICVFQSLLRSFWSSAFIRTLPQWVVRIGGTGQLDVSRKWMQP